MISNGNAFVSFMLRTKQNIEISVSNILFYFHGFLEYHMCCSTVVRLNGSNDKLHPDEYPTGR